MPTVLRLVDRVQARLWLRLGRWDLLERWLSAQVVPLPTPQTADQPFNEFDQVHLVTLARVWIARGRKLGDPHEFERALALLSQLEPAARRSGWVHALVEITLLQALALHELDKRGSGAGSALASLTHSLRLGLPAGYLQAYLQEGAPAAELLQAWLKSPAALSDHGDFKPYQVKDLLDRFNQAPAPAAPGRPGEALVEALTEREQDVLRLLALGLSNKEMAERMVVSEGTVKTHVHNLIGKLGAQSRTHVLARARDLGLL